MECQTFKRQAKCVMIQSLLNAVVMYDCTMHMIPDNICGNSAVLQTLLAIFLKHLACNAFCHL